MLQHTFIVFTMWAPINFNIYMTYSIMNKFMQQNFK